MFRLWLTYRSTVQLTLINSVLALSIFATLWTGVFSFAAVAFAALGGFLSCNLVVELGWPLTGAVVTGGVAGAIGSLLFSFPLLRLKSHYLALGSVALVLVTRVVVLNFGDLTGSTRGRGFPGIPATWFFVVVLAVALWPLVRVRRSRLGLAVEIAREDPEVAGTLGVDVRFVQRLFFVLSGALAGVGGACFGVFLGYIGPDTYYVNLAFVLLGAVILGGAYHWLGVVVGAAIFTFLPEILRIFMDRGNDIVRGLLILVIMVYLPRGLIDPNRTRERPRRMGWLRRPSSVSPTAQGVSSLGHASVKKSEAAVESVGDGPESPILELHGLAKDFGGVAAVQRLDLAVPRGIVFGLMGPNGAGKSTVLNVVCGLMEPTGGKIIFEGEEVGGLPAHVISRKGLARTFQNVRLPGGLSAVEQVSAGHAQGRRLRVWQMLLAAPRERAERKETARVALEKLALAGFGGDPAQAAETLSYGEQRRVELARALATGPRLIMLDEPSAGMNSAESARLGKLLVSLAAGGLSIIVIEHNLELVLDYCDRVAVMDSGTLLMEGTPSECLESPAVREAYFGKRSDAERIESMLQLRRDRGSARDQP